MNRNSHKAVTDATGRVVNVNRSRLQPRGESMTNRSFSRLAPLEVKDSETMGNNLILSPLPSAMYFAIAVQGISQV